MGCFGNRTDSLLESQRRNLSYRTGERAVVVVVVVADEEMMVAVAVILTMKMKRAAGVGVEEVDVEGWT